MRRSLRTSTNSSNRGGRRSRGVLRRLAGFDDLIVRVALATLTDEAQEQAKQLYALAHDDAQPEPFTVELGKVVDVIKSNAFPIEPPSEVLSFEPKSFGERPWRELREKTQGKNVVAVPQNGRVLALGTVDDVKHLFAAEMRGEVERVPIVPKDLARDEGAMISLLFSALTRALAKSTGSKQTAKRCSGRRR